MIILQKIYTVYTYIYSITHRHKYIVTFKGLWPTNEQNPAPVKWYLFLMYNIYNCCICCQIQYTR